jgi:diamine N-acetyltransferase
MSSLSSKPGRVGSLDEAQKLLEVPLPGGYAVWLDEHWRGELQGLLESCGDEMVLLFGGRPGPDAAAGLLRALPPGHDFQDKFVVGVFDGDGRMAGALIVVRDHPAPAEWTVDFLLVRPDRRGKGLATQMVESLERWVRSEGGNAIHLEARRHSREGVAFARRAGFEELGAAQESALAHWVRRLV